MPGGDRIDTVVLACTHFPLLDAELSRAFGPGVQFVHGAQGIARQIARLTAGQEWSRQAPDLALFTGLGDVPKAYGEMLTHYGLGRIERF